MKYLNRVTDFDSYYSQVTAGTLENICITLVDDKVYYKNLTNDIENPALMEIARNTGWVSSGATAMTYEDAYNVTNEQFNEAGEAIADNSAANGFNSTLKDLETFNEFKYFTQVTSTTFTAVDDTVEHYKGGFFNAAKLYSIKFPVSLKRLGANSFYYGKSLREIIFPPNYQGTVGNNAFAFTDRLVYVKFNSNMNVISGTTFYSQNGSCVFDFPDENKITYIGLQSLAHGWNSTLVNPVLNLPRIRLFHYEVFINQVGPRQINFGPTLETLGGGSAYTGTYNDIFNGYLETITIDPECPNFKCVDNIVYSKDGTICYGGANYGLEKRKTVTVAEGVTNLIAGSFRSFMSPADGDEWTCPWYNEADRICENLVLPSTLAQIGDRVCQYSNKIKRVVIYATTPPARVGQGVVSFLGPQKIYVPAESLQAYKTAWSNQAGKIEAITQDVLNAL